MKVNEALGELCLISDTDKSCKDTYRDRTWFLIRIAKETADAALDIESGEKVSSFLKIVNESKDFEVITKAADSLKDELEKLKNAR